MATFLLCLIDNWAIVVVRRKGSKDIFSIDWEWQISSGQNTDIASSGTRDPRAIAERKIIPKMIFKVYVKKKKERERESEKLCQKICSQVLINAQLNNLKIS